MKQTDGCGMEVKQHVKLREIIRDETHSEMSDETCKKEMKKECPKTYLPYPL
jgi:hypothetical protein